MGCLNMPQQDLTKFYESINKELMAVKDRLESLIGDIHRPENGRYREALLKNMISRFLPKKYSMGTGFVINKNKEITRQIDIIIYDNSSPVLFSEGGFVVVLASSVKAIIEVKTFIGSTTELLDIIRKNEENAQKIDITFAQSQKMFNGIFCYECNLFPETIKNSLENFFKLNECSIFRKVSNISLGNKTFLHLWWSHKPYSLKGYELPDLSFAYFICNLLISLDLDIEHESLLRPLESKNPFEKFEIVDDTGKWNRYI